MGFFTTRERAALGKSAEFRAEGARELVRHDFTPRRRLPSNKDLAGDIGGLMRQVTDGSLRRIDDLIAALRRRREELLGESERVQRAIIEYAELSQSTMQSTKIMTESLAHLNRVSAATSNSEPDVDRVSEEGDDEIESASLSPDDEDDATPAARAEAAETADGQAPQPTS